MVRWVVAALLATVVGSADAKRLECECFSGKRLPEYGATEVPYNTKLWRITSVANFEALERSIPPNTHYHPDELEFDFTTSDVQDTTAPKAPQGISASIVVYDKAQDNKQSTTDSMRGLTDVDQAPVLHAGEPGSEDTKRLVLPPDQLAGDRLAVDTLTIRGQFDDDVVLVRLEIEDAVGKQTWLVQPNRFVCNPRVALAKGRAKLTIIALDLAGNESPPVELETKVFASEEHASDVCFNRHFKCGTGAIAALMLGAAVLIGLVFAVAIIALIRRSRITRLPGDSVSLLVAEGVTRIVLKLRAITSALAIAATIGLWSLHYEITAALFVIVPVVQLWKLLCAHGVAKRLERNDVVAERRDDYLYVFSARGASWLRASSRIFAAAKRDNVPKSIQL